MHRWNIEKSKTKKEKKELVEKVFLIFSKELLFVIGRMIVSRVFYVKIFNVVIDASLDAAFELRNITKSVNYISTKTC